jgi:FtsZ-binding cell division protein ZapB
MRIESNRDWHRLVGDHTEECVFIEPETMMVPATDEQLSLIFRDWNTRTTQPVAMEGMPEPESECPYWTDSPQRNAWIQGAKQYHDAFTAWLSKAAQGLPDKEQFIAWFQSEPGRIADFHGGDLYDMEETRKAYEGWGAYADAVQPLVARLRAENSELRKLLAVRVEASRLDEMTNERDALQAEVERLKEENESLGSLCDYRFDAITALSGENKALRTTNAKLLGLLRKAESRQLNWAGDPLIDDIRALLASTGGGDTPTPNTPA